MSSEKPKLRPIVEALAKRVDEHDKKIAELSKPKEITCYRCGEKGHYANQCQARITYTYTCTGCDRDYKTQAQAERCACSSRNSNKCYRCGRQGHWASSCYARTHVNGHDLSSDDDEYNSE